MLRRNFGILLAVLLLFCAMIVSCGEEPVEMMIPPTSILRPDMSTEAETAAALDIRRAIREATGIEMELSTDWVKRGEEIPAAQSQILIGKTNRARSVSEADALAASRPNSAKDWLIMEEAGCIYILGCSDAAITEATAYFVETYIDNTGICMPVGERYLYQYPYADIRIGGEAIFSYSMPKAENSSLMSIRDWFAKTIGEAVGWSLPESGGKEIAMKLDEKLGKNDYAVKSAEGGVTVSGGSIDAIKQGAAVMLRKLMDGSAENGLNESGSITVHTPDTKAPAASGTYKSIGDPVYLIDDGKNLQSGWDRRMASSDWQSDATWSASNHYRISIGNRLVKEPVWMERPFQAQTQGVLTLEGVIATGGVNGLCIGVFDGETNKYAMRLLGKTGKLYAGDAELPLEGSNVLLRAEINLDTQKFTVWLDGKMAGPFDFADSVKRVDRLIFALAPDAASTVAPRAVLLHTKLPVLDRFTVQSKDTAPMGYEITGDVKITADADVRLNGAASMSRSFGAFDGRAAFEVKFLTSGFAEDTTFAITSGGKNVLGITLDGVAIKQGEDVLRMYDSNFWYTLRIEPDTRSQKAEVKINGKSYGWFDFENPAKSFDGVTIRSGEGDSVRVDEVWVFQINDHKDYVPAPKSSGSDGYYVAAQVCSLWRNGYHWGWDCISPFPELKPVLGYYDEGLPEVADWEIKYMAEHGVDYQIYCWYATQADQPIKNPGMYQQLHDGFFHAKYSDQMKFAIMWENANGTHPGNSENFRNIIVPYWVEYYLTDPRYMTIDNKPVITVFSYGTLLEDFGTAEKVKAEFDYLREVCRGLGYDGAIILVQSAATDSGTIGKIKSMGADAVYAYNWGKSNTSGVYINNVKNQQKTMDTIATISVGFNNVAWKGTRSELIKPDDYKTALEWVRDEHQKNFDKDSWLSRSIVLSTWNEYGEGTYIMPSGLHGFKYIDAVREVFAPDNKYENVTPTEDQLARLSTLYVQDRTLLRADYRSDDNDYSAYDTLVEWDFSAGSNGWTQLFGLSSCEASGGVLRGASTQSDYAVQSPDGLGIDADKVRAIRVVMKCSQPGGMEMFFTTDTSTSWSQDKSFGLSYSKAGEFVEYIIPAEGNAQMIGKLKALRFDPNRVPCEFEIKSISLLGVPDPERLERGVQVLKFEKFYPYVDAGTVMIPFDPKQAMLTFLSCGYRWDEKSQTLTVLHMDDTMVFTIGSDKAKFNGTDVTLKHKVDAMDGLPVLPIDDLLGQFGIDDVKVFVR